MNNSVLKYMLSNEPTKTLSINGYKIRTFIKPFVYNILKMSNKLKLVVDKKEFHGNSRPIIYVASHGFKDDVLNTVLTIKDNVYIVFGNIDLFFNTIDGFFLWLYGCQLVNRYDKTSRNAMKKKMDRVLKIGGNLVIFAEATWNLSPNKLMENLHWGFYDVGIANNALIVPIVTHKVGNKCYSQVLNGIELNKINQNDIVNILYLTKKYYNKALEICDDKNIYNAIINLKDIIESNNISLISANAKEIVKQLLLMKEKNNHDEFYVSKINYIIKLISRVGDAQKEYEVSKIRDMMATAKYELIEKYPDYSYMKNGKNKYEAWNDYLKDTINATPYFYVEPEQTTLFKDPLIFEENEVFNLKKIK